MSSARSRLNDVGLPTKSENTALVYIRLLHSCIFSLSLKFSPYLQSAGSKHTYTYLIYTVCLF